MRLTFEGDLNFRAHKYVYVIDEDTRKKVGYIRSEGTGFERGGGTIISLFGGKYIAQANMTAEYARGFVKGVEAVLAHMVDTYNPTTELHARIEELTNE